MGNFLAEVDCRQSLQRHLPAGFVSCGEIERTTEEQAKNFQFLSGGHEKKSAVFEQGVKCT